MPISAAPETHHVRALGRNPELQIEKALLFAVQHAPNQGNRIQITDRAHPQPWERIGSIQPSSVADDRCRSRYSLNSLMPSAIPNLVFSVEAVT